MYIEHEEVRTRKWTDTERFLDIHQVKFTGFRCPRPIFKFEHVNIPDYILNVIKEDKTFTKPTATQCLCWPVLLSGRDLIAVSNTGYGKHLSYMIPVLLHLRYQDAYKEQRGPCILILSPYQPPKEDIYTSTKAYLDAAKATCVCIFDTDSKTEQIEKLKTNFDILIANPIRLSEIFDENEDIRVNILKNISFLIIDEYIQFRKAQHMEYVKKIVEKIEKNHQTAVFSRLVPSGIQRQGDEFVKNCIFFEMHHDKESANDEVKQIIEIIDKNLKICRLVEIVDKLTRESDCKILIYAKDKEKCLTINQELKRYLDMDPLDFRKDEYKFPLKPNTVMSTFKNIGLEITIPDLQYIINVDFPPNLQTYMDRLRKGVVHYTLFCREDAKHAERLIYSLKQTRQEFDPHLYTMAKAWLECSRDIRFMPMIEDIKEGISKPLQEMVISDSEEDTNDSGIAGSQGNDGLTGSNMNVDNFDEDDEDEDEEDVDDDDDSSI